MAENAINIISMVESLPIDMKTKLLETLLNSINPTQKEIDELWAKESEMRIKEIKSGKIKTIPGSEVFVEIRERFAK